MDGVKKKAMTVPKKKLNAGVALLLERMKTNPEEFTVGDKWLSLIKQYRLFLNEEDRNALEAGLNELMQQKFTEQVMQELIDPKKLTTQDVINQYQVKGMASITKTITLEHDEHLKAHLKALGQTPIAGVTQTI
jgi:hypothetical protein